MSFFKIAIGLVISLLLLTGCYSKLEDYGYKSVENEFSWGRVGAKLIGNEKDYGRTAIRSSPYELFIWFGSDNFMEGVIYISELRVVNTKTKTVVFKKDNIIKKPIQKYTNNYSAYFSFEDIKLEYDEMLLHMKFTLKRGDKETEHKAEILFEKNYRKFRRIIGV